jgi:hypothetical protein
MSPPVVVDVAALKEAENGLARQGVQNVLWQYLP